MKSLKHANSRLKMVAKAVATVLLLGYLLYILDTEKLWSAVMGVEPFWLGVGILGSTTFVVSRIWKWRLLTENNGLYVPPWYLARLVLFSLVLGILTPGRIGEVVAIKPFPTRRRGDALLLYLFDRIGELCMVLLFAIPGCLVFFNLFGIGLAGAFLGFILVGIAIMLSDTLRARFATFLFINRISKVRDILTSSLEVPLIYWLACFLTYIQAYLLVIAFVVGAYSVGDWRMVLLLPIVTLSNLISVTVGGLGVREGLAAATLPLAGVPAEIGAAAFFLSFFFTRVVPGLLGALWVAVYNLVYARKLGHTQHAGLQGTQSGDIGSGTGADHHRKR